MRIYYATKEVSLGDLALTPDVATLAISFQNAIQPFKNTTRVAWRTTINSTTSFQMNSWKNGKISVCNAESECTKYTGMFFKTDQNFYF
jgi:hypothetical protein